MATVEKDFKVKNGLVVANGGSFGDAVTVGAPTLADHAATKEYVDSLTGSMTVSSTAPSSPTNGMQWFDTLAERVNTYYNGQWYTIATIADTQNIPQHIHDTAIGGTGFVVSQFVDAGLYNSPMSAAQDGGSATTTNFANTFDGGSAVDNFN